MKVYTSLDFDGNASIENTTRVDIYSVVDVISLEVRGFSVAQTSSIISVLDGNGSAVWKILGSGILEVYKDTKTIAGAHHIYSNHATRIISGLYITPLINNAVLSGTTNANSTRITDLTAGTSARDAANVTQVNSAISGQITGHLNTDDPHGMYLLTSPTGGQRNVILPASDFTPLIIDGPDGAGISNLLEVYAQDGGALLFNISSGGEVVIAAGFSAVSVSTLVGINNSSQKITSLAAGTASTDATNVTQMNTAVSGLLNAGNLRALYQVFDLPAISGTAEAELLYYNVASGTLAVDDGVRVSMRGYLLSNAGGHNFTFRIYWGSGLYIGEYIWQPASGIARPFECDFVVQNMNSRTKQLIHGSFHYTATPSFGAFSGIAQFGGWNQAGDIFMNNVESSYPNKDTAIQQPIRVTIQTGGASSALYAKLDYAEVRYMRGTT